LENERKNACKKTAIGKKETASNPIICHTIDLLPGLIERQLIQLLLPCRLGPCKGSKGKRMACECYFRFLAVKHQTLAQSPSLTRPPPAIPKLRLCIDQLSRHLDSDISAGEPVFARPHYIYTNPQIG
jgi:hypothetical protein